MTTSRYTNIAVFFTIVAIALAANGQVTPGTLEQLKVLPAFKDTPKLESLHKTAVKGIEQYRLMVNAENYKMLGLDRVADAAKTQLGTPSKDYLVKLDKLKEYKSGDDPTKLLSDTSIVHYPVMLDRKTPSTVTVYMQQGEWKVASIGDATRSEERSIAIKGAARYLNNIENSHIIIRVPALNLEFAGIFDASKQLQLTPIEDFPEWELKVGIPQPASTVFLKLVPAAKEHDGLPH